MEYTEFKEYYKIFKDSKNKDVESKLSQYKVTNAIIMAAGTSSRFAPLSYDKPKGLLKVKSEILIERQIRQLRKVGVNDITIITGYLSEQFQYLKDKYNVNLINNSDYFKYNNTSSLILVSDKLKNTYICSSDNYFEENPFNSHEFRSYYPVREVDFEADEYYVTFDENQLITDVSFESGKYFMIGHVYFDEKTSQNFTKILKREYSRDDVKEMLWEKLYIEFIEEIDLFAKIDRNKTIHEFDTLDELSLFDPDYLVYNNNEMLNNIAFYFEVSPKEIKNIVDMRDGMTNLSFKFEVENEAFVYRHPGFGTEEFISRHAEKVAQEIAAEMELDKTYLYMDEQKGYKISKYLDNCTILDYHNEEQVKTALAEIKRLHDKKIKVDHDFDIWQRTLDMLEGINNTEKSKYPDFESLFDIMKNIKKSTLEYSSETYLCHCDFFNTNILFQDNQSYLIDWEYAGNDDPACDLGIFVASSDYTLEQAINLLNIYEGGEMTKSKKEHFISYYALAAYYCFIWAVYQESNGQPSGEFLKIWYKSTKVYSNLLGLVK